MRPTPASAAGGQISLHGFIPIEKRTGRSTSSAASFPQPVIVLAENHESRRKALTKVLEQRGFDVITALHASDVLSIGRAFHGHIDFLITEVVFPGIDGGLLAHLFQRIHPEARVLFLSGSPEEVLICRDANRPGIAVLEQPVSLQVFAGKVSEMIRQ